MKRWNGKDVSRNAAEADTGATPLPVDEVRRRRREVLLIGVLAAIFLVLTASGARVPEFGSAGSPSGNVLFFLLINFNLILLVLLIFLVTRNLVKLSFERRRGILGSRLRTRLVLAFVGLSLAPTILLFVVAQGFLTTAIDSWFSGQVDRALSGALDVAHGHYQQVGNDGLHTARELAELIAARDLLSAEQAPRLQALLETKRAELNLTGIEVYDTAGSIAAARPETPQRWKLTVPPEDLQAALRRGQEFARTVPHRGGEMVRCGVPLRGPDGAIRGVVVAETLISRTMSRAAEGVARSYEEYRRLRLFRQPIKNSYTLSFVLITLVVVFSATWFGFYLAKGISAPIQRLGEGMRAVAQGNWNYRARPEGDEEFATLFNSFNQMTAELTTIHSALEERRRYIENVLAHVTAGVISLDGDGFVATVNPAAAAMLDVQAVDLVGRPWRDALSRADLQPLGEVVERVGEARQAPVERQLRLRGGARELTVWATATTLWDESGVASGTILFLEDVTHLLRVERMEAWREVARRIAHEIKNPLTPIQLSAQRLRKGVAESMAPRDRALLDECTQTIVGQVEQLKRLVNEFSTFARLPAAEVAPDDLNRAVEEALILFREGHRDIAFEFRPDPTLPLLEIDRDAVKRAVINLLDNAVAACQSAATADPRIELVTMYDTRVGAVRLEVADNGAGMAPDVKARAFEPYFSTKRDGTGLGLAIVSAIATDHHAYVRIRDNQPRGTRLIVEFPLRRTAPLGAAAGA